MTAFNAASIESLNSDISSESFGEGTAGAGAIGWGCDCIDIDVP